MGRKTHLRTNKSRRLGLTATVLGMLVAFATAQANANQIVQTHNVPLQPTDISVANGSGTFDYWQNVAPPLAVLDSVQLRISVTGVLQSLELTNNDPTNQQTFTYTSFSNISVNGSAPNADKNALLFGLFPGLDLIDTGPLTYDPLETKVFAPPALLNTADTGLIGAANFMDYDVLGSFTLGFSTQTFQAFSGGGGNGLSDQVTDAFGEITVIYNYTVIPEPGTWVLGGFGLVGLICAARRRRNRQ